MKQLTLSKEGIEIINALIKDPTAVNNQGRILLSSECNNYDHLADHEIDKYRDAIREVYYFLCDNKIATPYKETGLIVTTGTEYRELVRSGSIEKYWRLKQAIDPNEYIRDHLLASAIPSPIQQTINNISPTPPKKRSVLEIASWVFGILAASVVVYDFICKMIFARQK